MQTGTKTSTNQTRSTGIIPSCVRFTSPGNADYGNRHLQKATLNFLRKIYGHNKSCKRHFLWNGTCSRVLNKTSTQRAQPLRTSKPPAKAGINLNASDTLSSQLHLNGLTITLFLGVAAPQEARNSLKEPEWKHIPAPRSFIKSAFGIRCGRGGKWRCTLCLSREHHPRGLQGSHR